MDLTCKGLWGWEMKLFETTSEFLKFGCLKGFHYRASCDPNNVKMNIFSENHKNRPAAAGCFVPRPTSVVQVCWALLSKWDSFRKFLTFGSTPLLLQNSCSESIRNWPPTHRAKASWRTWRSGCRLPFPSCNPNNFKFTNSTPPTSVRMQLSRT